ncbi:MAG TPA: ATP-binding protein, partial [Candidatus Dormibacteraeota bacterium]|nr:ATP-binding protein [Candidatus Dormibacteraeota bacterium]
MTSRSRWAEQWMVWTAALLGPVAVTAVLVNFTNQIQRDYVFIYLGLVAVVGVVRGLWPALVCAAISFLLVDYFFVPPVGTLTIADEQDIVNLLAFMVTAVLVGVLASRRRHTLLESEALTRRLREANTELVRLNKEQAEASSAEIRLSRSEQQVKALQESDQLRRELLANVSHELRTPLATILTESTDVSEARSQEESAARLQTIAEEARRLKALVDDMLDMTVIEGGALELDLEPLDLGDAITAAVDRLKRTSPQRVIKSDAESSRVEVLADWNRLGQIFDNLLANANRFGPPGTLITVKVTHEEPGLVTIRVRDRGPGGAPELQQRIFERFFRNASEPESKGGTGLGLAIVRGLVEAHAGTVSVDEGAEKPGATFRFTLPEAP